jgi:hypothetical protein
MAKRGRSLRWADIPRGMGILRAVPVRERSGSRWQPNGCCRTAYGAPVARRGTRRGRMSHHLLGCVGKHLWEGER